MPKNGDFSGQMRLCKKSNKESVMMYCFYINLPTISMREQPSHQSKIVSEALFAEHVQIHQTQDGWSQITTSDGYPGWIPSDTLVMRQDPYMPTLTVTRLAAHLYSTPSIEYGPWKTLPYGSRLMELERDQVRWIQVALPDGQVAFIQQGDVALEPPIEHKQDLVLFSERFLGIPYTWGGRSSFGYDCSGFVQMLYSKLGVQLERDAKQQARDVHMLTIAQEQLEPGDLLFFAKSPEHLMGHVGLYLGNGRFIHGSSRESMPWIRYSDLTDREWSGEAGAFYTHRVYKQYTFFQ